MGIGAHKEWLQGHGKGLLPFEWEIRMMSRFCALEMGIEA